MLEFIVLGQVPGTHLQVNFVLVIMIGLVLSGLVLFVFLIMRYWQRAVNAAYKVRFIEHFTI